MIDLFLKFTSEAQANSVLYKADGEPKYTNISVIGLIYKPTGQTDNEGNPVMSALDGWHVNLRVIDEEATELEQYAIIPTNPVRVWA